MKRNKIRMNESQLRNIIKESVKRVLRENKKFPNPMGGPEDRINAYPEYAKDWQEDEPMSPIPNKERLFTLDSTTDAWGDFKPGDHAYYDDGEVYPSAEWCDTDMYGKPHHYSEWAKQADKDLEDLQQKRFKDKLDRTWNNTKEMDRISKKADSRPLHRKGSLNREI